MPLTVTDVLLQVVLPALIAVLVTAGALWPRRPASAMRVAIAITIALALGTLAAIIAGGSFDPLFDGIEQTFGQRLRRLGIPAWIGIVLLPVGVMLVIARELPRVPAMLVWIARVVIAFGIGQALPIILPGLAYEWDSEGVRLAWTCGIGVVLLMAWFATRIAAGREGGRLSLLMTALSGAVLAVISVMSGSIAISVLAGAIALLTGMAWIGWMVAARHVRAGAVDMATMLLMAMVVYAQSYLDDQMHISQSLLILAAPLAAGLLRLKQLRSRHVLLNAALSLVLCFALLGAALGISIRPKLAGDTERTQQQDGGGYDYYRMYQ